MKLERARLAAGAAALAAALCVAGFSSRQESGRLSVQEYSIPGEILAHGIRSRAEAISVRMPLASIVWARLDHHAQTSYGRLVSGQRMLKVLLIFAAGFLLQPWGGLVAASVFIVPAVTGRNLEPDAGYALLILLTAGLLVWRARAPSPARSAWLAAAVGAGLMWRSPLAFFTPALALYEWSVEHRFSFKPYRKQFLILCVVPYLFLLPWIAMNWTIDRRLVIFERGTANSNIVTGALGLVENIEGDIKTIVDEPIDTTDTGAVVGWALRRVIRHPADYARAYALRLKYVLSLQPLLALLAAVGFWAFRKRREYRELSFLAAYFIGVHCLMAVEPRYFTPLWPLLALLACSLPARLIARSDRGTDWPESRSASGFLKAAAILTVALCVDANWKVLSFASLVRGGPADGEAELSRALLSSPDDGWLLQERGKERSDRGDLAGALQDYSRAAALDPGNPSVSLDQARVEALLGRPERLLAWRGPDADADADAEMLAIDSDILKACADLRLGRKGEALRRVEAARERFRSRNIVVRGLRGERENRVYDRLLSSEMGFAAHFREVEGPRPAAEESALIDLLAAADSEFSEVWIEKAELEAKTGKRAQALGDLARAEKRGLDTDEKRRALLRVYRELKEDGRASSPPETPSRSRPDEAELLIERGELAARQGKNEQALEFLARAEKRCLVDGDHDGEQRRRIAFAYQNLKEYGRALDLFARLTRLSPAVASFYSDKGVCEYLMGAGDAALGDLRTAIRLEPNYLPASLTAGTILEGRGRFGEAAKIYDEALSRTASAGADPLRASLTEARASLLAKHPR